jgi:hypothetical protein
MSAPKVLPTRLTPTERRKLVDLGIKAGKSNRAIAKEVDVDERMIRLDRKFLATPENERPFKIPRPKKPKSPQLHWKQMLTAVKRWITQEGLIRPDLELFVLPEADKLLHRNRRTQSQLQEPVKSPDELLSLTRPPYAVEDYMPSKLGFYAEWLAEWLACCLPREEQLQDEFLRQTSIWARSWR